MTVSQDQASVLLVTKPVTYEELTLEHKQKYDEIKAQFEADLIGSFERTRSHGSGGRGSHPKALSTTLTCPYHQKNAPEPYAWR